MQTTAKDQLAKYDPQLEPIISTIPEPRIESTNEVFHDLMSCILEQQIHYRSTKRIFQKMLDRAGIETLTLSNFDVFEAKAFEGVKLSARKYETVLRIIEYWQENNMDNMDWTALTDDEVRETLSSIKGIGKWTIDMILMFTLERPDVFPFDDFHLKQIMSSIYGLNPKSKLKAQMIEVAKKWEGHRSLAVQYLWDWKKFEKQKGKK